MLFFWKSYGSDTFRQIIAGWISMFGSILRTCAALALFALPAVGANEIFSGSTVPIVIAVILGVVIGIFVFIVLKRVTDKLTDKIAG